MTTFSLMKKTLTILVLFSYVSLSGCGFHFRGQDYPHFQHHYTSIYIDIEKPYAQFNKQLTTALQHAGATFAPSQSQAQTILHITDIHTDKHESAISTNTQKRRYLLTSHLHYELTNHAGAPITPAKTITAHRSFTTTQNKILGANQERGIIQYELNQDLIHQLLAIM